MRAPLVEDWQHGGFGIYVHWPFCESKCPYCDFNSHVVSHVDQDVWLKAYVSELERVFQETGPRAVKSVFFGGGTPSLMDPSVVDGVLNKIAALWSMSNDVEITLEANPSSVEAERFAAYAFSGVNRVSLGIQALNEADLKRLGRLHSVEEALDALEVAKNAFSRVSFDLIYARQNQSLSDWEAELTGALALAGDHLSLYQLTIEPGTAFGSRFEAGGLRGLPSEDLSADMYELTQRLCADAGLPAYEVSNHAAAGNESRHNKVYWECGDYVGIGPGAHGRLTLNGTRFATETELAPFGWLKSVQADGSGETMRDVLSAEDHISELVLMGLRLNTGILKSRLLETVSDGFWRSAKRLEEQRLLVMSDDRLCLTKRGRPLLNAVAKELLAYH